VTGLAVRSSTVRRVLAVLFVGGLATCLQLPAPASGARSWHFERELRPLRCALPGERRLLGGG
jgi:hypothetical protein